MKLLETTYNEDWPSFKLGTLNKKGQGVNFGESVTIQLPSAGKDPLDIRTIEYKVTESNVRKGQKVGDTASFVKTTLTGKIISDNVDNIKYNKYENAAFEISEKMGVKLSELGDKLKGMTIEFGVTSFEKEKPDGKTEEIIYLQMSEVGEDGSAVEIGGNSSTPTPKINTTDAVPPAVLAMNKEVTSDSIQLTDVEKSIFKEVRTNPAVKDFIDFGKTNLEQFKVMMGEISKFISVQNSAEDRMGDLYKEFCK